MKATLEFNLPEDEHDHKYALAGLDALLAIDDILSDLRSAYKHEAGELHKMRNEDTGFLEETCKDTLFAVAQRIHEIKESRNLPELI
jgi:hypothetical protein